MTQDLELDPLEREHEERLRRIEAEAVQDLGKADRIFLDRSWLTSKRHPRTPIHRSDEYETVLSWFTPALRRKGEMVVLGPSIITGKPGLGKTMVVARVLEWVSERAKAQGVSMAPYVLLNAKDSSLRSILFAILNRVGQKDDIPASENGLSKDDYFHRINEGMAANNYEILLLAVDDAQKANLLDALVLNSGKEAKFNFPLQLLVISNNHLFKQQLSAEAQSACGPRALNFEPYDGTQLKEILQYRGGKAFRPGVVDDVVYELAAGLTKSYFNSDVRDGMKLLELSADTANARVPDKEKPVRITADDVQAARHDLEIGLVRNRISELQKATPPAVLALLAMGLLYRCNVLDPTQKDISDTVIEVCGERAKWSHTRFYEFLSELDERRTGLIKGNLERGGAKGNQNTYRLLEPEKVCEALKRMDAIRIAKDADAVYPPMLFEDLEKGDLRLSRDNRSQKRIT